MLHVRRLPHHSGRPLSARHYLSDPDSYADEASSRVPNSHPIPSLPLACGTWTEQAPLGFPVSFAPDRYRPRTSRWGRVTDTDPGSRHQHLSTSARRTHSPRAASCRKHFAYLPVIWFPITCAPSPCARRYRPPWPGVTPATTTGTEPFPGNFPIALGDRVRGAAVLALGAVDCFGAAFPRCRWWPRACTSSDPSAVRGVFGCASWRDCRAFLSGRHVHWPVADSARL